MSWNSNFCWFLASACTRCILQNQILSNWEKRWKSDCNNNKLWNAGKCQRANCNKIDLSMVLSDKQDAKIILPTDL